nr:putative DeoR/GlpR transcriptional regulator [uncultured bacterium]
MDQLNSRQAAILNQLRTQGRVLVDDLSEVFVSTPQTIRRDLKVLAGTGEVIRFHGGATLRTGVEYTGFEARRNIAVEQKEAIGRATAGYIPNNSVIMVNAGTTTAAVARALSRHAGLRIITDNVSVANELRVFAGSEVIVPGGTVRRSDGAILGEGAVEFIRQFRADIAVIGTAALDQEGALLDFDLREAHVARAMIACSRTVIVATDSSKFSNTAPVQIGHLEQVDVLVTDKGENGKAERLCEKFGVTMIVA